MSPTHPTPRPRRSVPRRRVSRQRYLVRRIGVLAVAAALVVGGVRLVAAVAEGDDGTPAEASAPGAAPGPTDEAGAEVLTGGTVADAPIGSAVTVPTATSGSVATDATAPVEPAPTGPPTAESPARVLIVGDSDAGTFGPYLQVLLDETGVVETTLDYKVSSGLARPDFFDWPAELDRIVPEVDPDIVVVTFGGNDAQGLATSSGEFIVGEPRPGSDNAEWREEYGRRVGAVMDQLLADGRTVIWVGIPNDDNPDVTFRMQVQDETAKAAAAERPAIRFVDTWSRFAGRNGGWAEYVVDPRDGVGKDVRAADGFHLNEAGAEILALDIMTVIRDDLRARGAAI